MAHVHSHNAFNQHHLPHGKDAALIKAAGYCSLLAVTIIIISKIIGFVITGSLAMLASLTDSLLDAVTSGINVVAIRYALQPPDKEHRFGHGKAEDLAVFVQSSIFALSAIFILGAAVRRFFVPEALSHGEEGMMVMCFTIAVTLALLIFQKYVIKKTNSAIIEADHLHYFIDILSNAAVIISLLITKTLHTEYADPIFALLISAYMLYGSWQLIQRAFKNLMDHEFDDDQREQILQVIKLHPEVRAINELKTRRAGIKPFIQFHLAFDGSKTIIDVAQTTSKIKEELLKIFPTADIIIQQDASNLHRNE
jgi:ferrous-iron efflux pump FieF